MIVGVLTFAAPALAGGPTIELPGSEPGADATASVRGTVRFEGEPVEDAAITISEADGDEIETVATDEDGRWELELEGGGDFEAVLDLDTLPEGAELREEGGDVVEFSLQAGQADTILFPLGEGSTGSSVSLERFLQLLVEGISFGLVIALAAIGLSLIFGTTGLVNFAHGEMVTAGAMIAWYLNVRTGLQLIPATIITMGVCFGLGYLIDLGFWGQLRRRGTGLIAQLVISIGVSILARYFYLYLIGGRTKPYNDYSVQRAIDLGPVGVTPKDLTGIVVSIAVLVAVGLVLQRTRIGKATRAVADNRDLAASSGIDVQRVIHFVWAAGFGLAALGGVLLGVTEQVSFEMGYRLLLLMFAGVILGGLGTAYGALVGSLVVGIFVQVSTLWISPELKNVGALVILILILLVRPQGILGQRERVG